MIRRLLFALMLVSASAALAVETHPEARPFAETINAEANLESALISAASNNRKVVVVMGANWCHDSRALAGWLATPRFAAILRERYETVYVDVGTPQTGKGRNLDIAKRFDLKKVKSTPIVLILSPEGKLLNSRKGAIAWRNAASRSEDAIYRYFADFKPVQK